MKPIYLLIIGAISGLALGLIAMGITLRFAHKHVDTRNTLAPIIEKQPQPTDKVNMWVLREGSGSNKDPHILVIHDSSSNVQYFVVTNGNGVTISRRF